MPREKSAWIPYACTEYVDSTLILKSLYASRFALHIYVHYTKEIANDTGAYDKFWIAQIILFYLKVYKMILFVEKFSWSLPIKRDFSIQVLVTAIFSCRFCLHF